METVLRDQLHTVALHWDLTIVSTTITPELRDQVKWIRIRVPRKPAWVKVLSFWAVAGSAVARETRSRTGRTIIWTIGAIIPQRIDVASVHFCHRGFIKTVGWSAGVRGARKWNSTLARFIGALLEAWSYRPSRVRVLMAVSQGLAEEVRAAFPGTQVCVTPNGVHEVENLEPRETRDENTPLALLFVGGDWGRKGIESCLRVVEQVDDVYLTVVGDGPASLGPDLARQLDIEDRVVFVRWTANVDQYYRKADVLLLPSSYETFGMVLYEAASHGVVPVSTPVHGAVDLIRSGENGYLVPHGDMATLVSRVRRLRDDRDHLKALSKRGVLDATKFSSERSVASVVEILVKLDF